MFMLHALCGDTGHKDVFEGTKLLGEYQKILKGRKPNLIQSWYVIAQFLELYWAEISHSKREPRGELLLKQCGQLKTINQWE